jgi:uncharacterized membrane protein YhaH (DUF805 family)
MNPIRLFLSFDGRIGRIAFWAGLLLLAAASPFTLGTVMSDNPLDDAVLAVRRFGFSGFVWSLALLTGVAALLVKRLHDRGKSGFRAALFYLPAAFAALDYFGASGLPMLADVMTWTSWMAWLAGASGLWFLVSLGLWPGQKGANKYGPDPRGD